jgi:hypothetical protein
MQPDARIRKSILEKKNGLWIEVRDLSYMFLTAASCT